MCGGAQDLAGALFRGAGEVPAIAALQLYIEEAWVRGWDRAGAKQLGMQLRGATTWIGTTEIAALLRASRVRARIVDFEGGAAQVLTIPLAMLPVEESSSVSSCRCDVEV